MAKTTAEKIALKKAEMEQLENELKRLTEQHKAEERKARTSRLCKRHGLFESLLPDTIPLSEERFKAFLSRTVCSDEAKAILRDLLDEQELEAEIAAEESAKTTSGNRSAESVGDKPADALRNTGGNPANPAQSGGNAQSARPPEAQKAAG
jgi:hypothetical protein